MVLGFKKRFVPKILQGIKIHTFREDAKCRWSAGQTIHFATGTRTKHYNQFHEDTCKSVQEVWIKPSSRTIRVLRHTGDFEIDWVHIDTERFAKNDGFDTTGDFWEWFNEETRGRVIHWTDFKY